MYISVQNRQSPAQKEAAEEERKKRARLASLSFKKVVKRTEYRFTPTFPTDRVIEVAGVDRDVITLSPKNLGIVKPITLRTFVRTVAAEELELLSHGHNFTREIRPNEKLEFIRKKKRTPTTLEACSV